MAAAARLRYLSGLDDRAPGTLDRAGLNRLLFLRWLNRQHPEVYSRVTTQDRAPRSQMAGLFDSLSGAFSALTDNASKIARTVLDYKTATAAQKAQYQLLQQNIQRANMGLPPLNADGSEVTASQIGNTATARDVMLANAGGVPVWAWAALGGLGIYFLAKRR